MHVRGVGRGEKIWAENELSECGEESVESEGGKEERGRVEEQEQRRSRNSANDKIIRSCLVVKVISCYWCRGLSLRRMGRWG